MSETNCQAEVIDLTDSFTLANHRILSNTVIELLDSDESFAMSPVAVKKKNFKPKVSLPNKQSLEKQKIPQAEQIPQPKENKSHNSLLCPICWEVLGKSTIVSTMCGHVFCMKCLKNCLKINKKCPTCRTTLKGSSAYHPLYLSGF